MTGGEPNNGSQTLICVFDYVLENPQVRSAFEYNLQSVWTTVWAKYKDYVQRLCTGEQIEHSCSL